MSKKNQPVSNLIKNSAVKLMATTAMTAAGLLAISGAAKAADDFGDHTYDGGSAGSSLTVTVDVPTKTTTLDAVGSLVKARGDADLAADWTANINQDNASAKYVLFDTEGDASYILGKLNANGQVYIFDRDGVVFGADSVVNVGSIIASSGELLSTDAELDAGDIIINSVATDGDVINHGSITVAEAGIAGFVAPTVTNSGVINARLGNVVMAAGETVTLDLYGDGLVEVAVDGELADGLITHTGEINAQGGNVQISAAIAKAAVDNVINMSGVVTTSSAVQQGGKIVISGGESGRVVVNRALNANGRGDQDAGEISVTGENVQIGGSGRLRADSDNGAAGKIETIATNELMVLGRLTAQGLAGTGEIETSAPTTSFGSAASILATREWLLDPTNLTINTLLAGMINSQLDVGDMTVQTNGGGAGAGNVVLDSGASILKTSATDSTFTINAHNDITINGTIGATGTGALNVNLDADFDQSGGDADVFVRNNISTNGGTFTATASDDIDVKNGAIIDTDGGDITLTSRGLGNGSWLWMPNGGAGTGRLSSNGGDINIQVDNFHLADGSSIDADTGTVNISRDVAGTIGLGAATGDMELTAAELARIDAAALTIGGANTTGIDVDTVDTTSNTIAGLVTLNALGAGGDVNFDGANTFAALAATADDDVHVRAGSSITTTTGGVSLTANNSSGGGNTVNQIEGTIDTTAAGADGDVDLAATDYFVEVDATGKILTDGGKLTVTSNHGFDIDNGAMVMLGNGGAHIDAPLVQLGEDIDTTGAITGTANTVQVENDDAQIQDGVDVAANNATVNVAAGTYEESVVVNKTGLQLLGANAGTDGFFTLRLPESIVTGASPAFTVTSDNVTIDGFTMDGPTLTHGVLLNDVKGIEVVNNIIKNSSVAGIGGVVDHDDAVQVDLLIEGNRIDDSNTGDGINIAGDGAGSAASPALVGSRVDITNNLIGTDGEDAGSANNGVGGSAIVFSTIGDPAGIIDAHWAYDVTTASEINITSNYIRGAVDGIRFDGGVDEATVNISGNSNVNGLTGEGVQVNGDITNSDIDINSNGTVSGSVRAIDLAGHVDDANVEIDGNTTIFARHNDAIRFSGVTNGSIVNITDNGAITSVFGNGISFDAGSPSIDGGSVVTIANNTISADDDGIVVIDSVTGAGSKLKVGGNTITAGEDGVDIDHISNGGHVDIGGVVAHDSASTSTNKGNVIDAGDDGVEFDAGIDAIAQVRSNRISAGNDGVHVEDRDSGHTTGVDSGAIVNILDNDIGSVGSDTIGDDGIDFDDSITGNSTVTISGNSIGRSGAKVGDDGIDIDSITGGATVNITNNPDIRAADNGIEISGVVNGGASLTIQGNNHGIHADDHGIYFGSAISGGALVNIHDNIIGANEDGDSTGSGIWFDDTITTATVNIGDGTLSPTNGGASNIIRVDGTGGDNSDLDAIHFDDEIGTGAVINIDGNRLGYWAASVGGTLYNERLADDGIEFAGPITGNADINVTDNHIRARGDGVVFSDEVRDMANVLIGGVNDGNRINAWDDGVQFGDEVEGEALIEISYNNITAYDDGVHFAEQVSNAKTTGGTSENEILIKNNTIWADDNGIRFSGEVDGSAHDTRIIGNSITADDEHGIVFEDDIDEAHVRIIENTKIEGEIDGIRFDGDVEDGARVNIDDNTSIEGNDEDAIHFAGEVEEATVSIFSNDDIRGDDNGIQFDGEIDDSTIVISENNHGIHARNHGIVFYSAIYGGSDIDIHDNIISANESGGSIGDGVHFGGNIYTATINIGDGGMGSFSGSASNWIRGRDGIHFAGSLNTGTEVVIDGNRIGYGKTSGGTTYPDRMDDDGIQFIGDVQGNANVKITDNYINSDDDGVSFIGEIEDDARVLIGGYRDGNVIRSRDEGVQFEDEVKNHSLLAITHNDIEADGNGIEFNEDTSNHIHSGHGEEILIAYNSIEADDNGILFEGEANNWRHDIMIRNNTKIHGHDGDGIRHEGGIDDAELTIRNNDDVFGEYDAIHVEGAFRNDAKILITENTDIDTRYGDGIEVTQSGGAGGVDLDITRNHIHYVGDNGVEVDNVDDADISRNRIHDTGNDGVNVEGGYDVAIYRNNIDDTDGNGIYVEDSDEAYVSWNDIDGTGENGIYINSSDSVDVFGNEIDDTDEHGIKVNPSDFVNIAYNRIHDAGWDGINVDGGLFADIYENHVHRVGDDGIDVDGNFGVDIYENVVRRTGLAWWSVDGNGIEVSNSFDADIRRNYIERAGDDGIEVDDSAFADIRNNRVRRSGDDGIDVDDSYRVDINGNRINGARDNGIKVTDSFDADVIGNRIRFVGDDGIYARNVFGADIRFNNVRFAGRDGIDVEDSNFVDVMFNRVDRVGGNGIEVQNSDFADILFNGVTRARENGIYVNPSDFVDVGFNAVFFSGRNGIDVNGGHFIDVFYNLTGFNGRDGINVDGSRHVDIMNNISFANRGDGIDVNANHYGFHSSPNRINITGNRTNYNGDNGIEVSGNRNINGIELLVDANTTNYNGDNGIEIIAEGGFSGPTTKVSLVSLVPGEFNSVISNNIVEENTSNGLFVAGGGHNNVEVSGNDFIENDIGAQFESGTIDLTGDGNLFEGGSIGMRFAPFDFGGSFAPMELVGNTIGAQTFDGQDTYVELDNGAFFEPGTPTLLDATDSTYLNTPFGTIGPQLFYSAEQIAFLESKFFHFNDDGTLGLFFFPQLADIDQEDIFQFFANGGGDLGGLNVTILGMPGVPGGPQTASFFNNIAPAGGGNSPEALNNINPAAGGNGGLTPEQLNDLETAAGGEEGNSASCWGDAMNAAGAGGAVNFSYGSGAEGLLNSEASCGS